MEALAIHNVILHTGSCTPSGQMKCGPLDRISMAAYDERPARKMLCEKWLHTCGSGAFGQKACDFESDRRSRPVKRIREQSTERKKSAA